MKPVELKLGQIKLSTAANITLLQTSLNEKESTIATLTDIICNMQSSLNRIDADERNTNIIVAGLPETDMMDNEEGELKTVEDKVKRLVQVMNVDETIVQAADTFDYSRIGQSRPNSIRLVKVNV